MGVMTEAVTSTIGAAEARYRAGDFGGAEALLSAAPETPDGLRLLALCRLRQNDAEAALTLFAQARELALGDPWVALHAGIGLQSVNRHAEAAALFRHAAQNLPDEAAPLLNLSNTLLALGDVNGAIAAARKGRLRAQSMPEAAYILGLAYLAGGLLDKAAECFTAATRLAPKFTDAWINLGVAHYRAGEIYAACGAMQTALQTAPGNAVAAANLGAFLRLTGEVAAGEAMLQAVVKANPNAVAARINLAADLLQEDRAAEALALLDGAKPEPGPMHQHWVLQRALALIKLRRPAEAKAALDDIGVIAPALAPLLNWRLALLAVADGDHAAADGHAEAMDAGLGAAAMLPEHRIMAHYDLARFWSQRGDTNRAFANWTSGHGQLARSQKFSREGYAAFVKASIAAFDAARLAGLRAQNADETPVFVVGMPRSGTTLIEQILSAHGQVYGAGERAALGQAFWQLGGSDTAAAVQRAAGQSGEALNSYAARYLTELHRIDPGAARIVDKMPGNFKYLGLASLLLPGARVIACERDPRDIGLSIFTFRFYGVHAYAHDLSDLGWYIGQQRRLMAHWRAVLPNPILTVKLTDWVEDFDGTLARVLAFLGLPYDPACARFHEVERRVRTVSRTQVRERVNAKGIGRWRAYERHLEPLIAALREAGVLDEGGQEIV
jgi:tetratricopeptide (TPR) repeat protein